MDSGDIRTEDISQNQFDQLLVNSVIANNSASLVSADGIINKGTVTRSIRSFFSDIGDAFSDLASITFGFANDAWNLLIDIGGKIIHFIVDTVKKAAEFVEALIKKVVESIKQFIEFLRFLFNWEDFLKTQRYLVKSINSAFDSVSDMVAAAREPVSRFVNDVQEGLDDGIDSLIQALGVDPDEIKEDSGFELPKAAEWFLNKVMGGSKKSGAKPTPDAESTDESEGSSFQQALEHLLAALVDVVEIGGTVFDGLFDTVETLITNPGRPELALAEILDTFRDVGIKILDFGENIILTFLDLLVTAIDLLRDFLNREIRIPLISELFKLLGAGKLSILNLISLILAIPTTVLSKLIFGEAPFKDVAHDFPKQVLIAGEQGVALLENQSALQAEPAINIENTRRKMIGFGVVAIVADLINGLISTSLDLVPEEADRDGEGTSFLEWLSLLLSGFSWLASFPASPVEPGGYPYNLLLDKNRVSKNQDEQEYWQHVVWGWQTGILGLDIVYMIAGTMLEKIPKQRLKRANDITAIFITLSSLVEVGLIGRYLATIPKEDGRARNVANEVLGKLPYTFALLRNNTNPTTAFATLSALFVLNVVSTVSTTAFSMRFLRESVSDLTET